MSKVIGIDLGTTHSAVAVIEGGEPVIVATAEGGRLCPSVVGFNRHGERLVGQVARRQAVLDPENTVFSIKRLMGRRVDDPDVRQARRIMPYRIVGGAEGDARVHAPRMARSYAPQEISAMILSKLKADAEAYLGEPVKQAVITVPAYFNDSQRQATKDAGQIAGLDVVRIVNEPTAAALAYGLDRQSPKTIVVFDLGGGTFDVSVLEVGDGVVEVRSTCGDTFLGGDDWDRRIAEYVVEVFKREQGIDLRADRQALQRIREAAEKAKVELSSVTETEINLPFIAVDAGGPRHVQVKLTRAWLEQLTGDLVQLCVGPFERALRDAELSADQVDEVLLVGGATRMPMIRDLVRKLTYGKEPRQSVNPDEVVAAGAAVQAGVLSGEVREVLLLDVTPLTLGVETVGGVRTPLIERNTKIPVRRSEVFSTAVDWQPAVMVRVLQGERSMASDNTLLGQFTLAGIRPAPRGVPQIEVTFDIDANGILQVSARDRATGAEQAISITASTNLSREDVARMVREARQNEAVDRRRKELVEARNAADAAIDAAHRALRERGRAVPAGERSTIELTIKELTVAKEGRDSVWIWHMVKLLR